MPNFDDEMTELRAQIAEHMKTRREVLEDPKNAKTRFDIEMHWNAGNSAGKLMGALATLERLKKGGWFS